jgi:hypothetical protein
MTTRRDHLVRLQHTTIVREEDIERLLTEGLDEVTKFAAAHAEATRRNYLEQVEPNEESESPSPELASDADRFVNAVRGYLEDHVMVLDEPSDDVNSNDLERALIRQALVRLRAPALEQILRLQGATPASKRASELARQVADSYGWDPAAVARVVLDHTEEPQATANGWSTRIFQMKEPVDANQVGPYVEIALRRFVPVGAVKWFVFDRMEVSGELSIRLSGRLRTFTPKPNETADGATAVLGSESATYAATLVVDDGSRMVRVEQAHTTTAARAAVSAFTKLTLSERQTWLSGAERDAASIPGRLHPQTQLLLEIVRSRLPAELFSRKNATLARFRVSAASQTDSDADTASISAWRAEGRHLLNTPSASKLMLSEGRPLVDLTFDASVAGESGGHEVGRCSTRFVLDSDHVLIETGLAGADGETTRAAHRAAVGAVEAALRDGVSEYVVAELTDEIKRNESATSTTGPSILDGPQESRDR